jgi:hypothetical protein
MAAAGAAAASGLGSATACRLRRSGSGRRGKGGSGGAWPRNGTAGSTTRPTWFPPLVRAEEVSRRGCGENLVCLTCQ